MTRSTVLWRATGLSLGTASALGFARFAYGLLVPAMREKLGLTLGDAGELSAANGFGYVAGAAATHIFVSRLSLTTTFRAGMILVAASLAATAGSVDFGLLAAARAVAGFGAALVFITGGVIAADMAASIGSALPVTVYFAGAGLGTAISGSLIPLLLDGYPGRWDDGWMWLAAFAVLASIGSWRAAQISTNPRAPSPTGHNGQWSWWRVAAAYVLFGAGYLTYLTFLSAYLAARNTPAIQVAAMWTVIGVSVIVSPLLWSRAIGNWAGARALTTILAAIAAAAALPLFRFTWTTMLVSALIFGLTFMAVPAAITNLLRQSISSHRLAATLATFTMLFAAGQAAGPWIAGQIADRTGTSATLGWTAAMCAAAAGLAACSKRSSAPSNQERPAAVPAKAPP